jgi:hypothetical protein
MKRIHVIGLSVVGFAVASLLCGMAIMLVMIRREVTENILDGKTHHINDIAITMTGSELTQYGTKIYLTIENNSEGSINTPIAGIEVTDGFGNPIGTESDCVDIDVLPGKPLNGYVEFIDNKVPPKSYLVYVVLYTSNIGKSEINDMEESRHHRIIKKGQIKKPAINAG